MEKSINVADVVPVVEETAAEETAAEGMVEWARDAAVEAVNANALISRKRHKGFELRT